MQLPRKQLLELVALYELEPGLRDVFVEGPFDVAIIKWFLDQKGLIGTVYDISTVEIPDDEIRNRGRKANNYERVAFLAEYAENCLQPNQKQVTCVVDRDFADFLQEVRDIGSLLYTDYSCMEMYSFNETTLDKFFTVYCNKTNWPAGAIIRSLASMLQELFLLRLANEVLGWEMRFLEKLPCMVVVGWAIEFDSEEFLRRYLNKNDRMSVMDEFSRVVNSYRGQLGGDPRCQIQGHDFVEVLCWFLRQKGVAGDVANARIVGRVLVVSLSAEQLEGTQLFGCLAQRVGTNET